MANYTALIQYIESVKNKSFTWGTHDCCMFANNCMLAFVGEDFMPEFKGKYTDLESAGAAIRDIGSRTLYHTMVKKFGRPFNIARAKRGDIIYKRDGLEGPSLGICMGAITYFAGETGLVEVNTLECEGAWAK